MAEKISIQDLSRQPLVRGTSCFTDPTGNVGYKNEDIQVSALVRIAASLERLVELAEAGDARDVLVESVALYREGGQDNG
jgi:hypothetical protein